MQRLFLLPYPGLYQQLFRLQQSTARLCATDHQGSKKGDSVQGVFACMDLFRKNWQDLQQGFLLHILCGKKWNDPRSLSLVVGKVVLLLVAVDVTCTGAVPDWCDILWEGAL